MKRMVPYVMFGLVLTALLFIILKNNEQKQLKMISIESAHYVYYQKDKTFKVPIYMNKQKSGYDTHEGIGSVMLKNKSSLNQINLDLISIEYSHHEAYLDEDYYLYYYVFETPFLGTNIMFDEASLVIEAINGNETILKIGCVTFNYHVPSQDNPLFWEVIDVAKNLDQKVESIYQVVIRFEAIKMDIEQVTIDGFNAYDFLYDESTYTLTITLDYEYIYHDIFVEIDYVYQAQAYKLIIPNYMYLISYAFLVSQDNMVHIYEVN